MKSLTLTEIPKAHHVANELYFQDKFLQDVKQYMFLVKLCVLNDDDFLSDKVKRIRILCQHYKTATDNNFCSKLPIAPEVKPLYKCLLNIQRISADSSSIDDEGSLGTFTKYLNRYQNSFKTVNERYKNIVAQLKYSIQNIESKHQKVQYFKYLKQITSSESLPDSLSKDIQSTSCSCKIPCITDIDEID